MALAVSAAPLFVGLVASHKRGEALLAYLAERGVPQHLLDRVRTPVGLDLGPDQPPGDRGVGARRARAAPGRRGVRGRPGSAAADSAPATTEVARSRVRDDRHRRRGPLPGRARRDRPTTSAAPAARSPSPPTPRSTSAKRRHEAMLIKNQFDVAEPLDKVWEFFGNVPQVAACLPGAELTDDLGDETYGGTVGIRMGPVKLQFAGKAKIVERDDADQRMVIDAAGSDQKGRGQAAMTITAPLAAGPAPAPRSTSTRTSSSPGAAAQYGRGMIQDVTTVLMGQFAGNMQQRIGALERGESLDGVGDVVGERPRDRPPGGADGADAGLPPVLPPLPTGPRLRSRHGPVVDRQHRAPAGGRAGARRPAQPGARRARADPRRGRRHPGRRGPARR